MVGDIILMYRLHDVYIRVYIWSGSFFFFFFLVGNKVNKQSKHVILYHINKIKERETLFFFSFVCCSYVSHQFMLNLQMKNAFGCYCYFWRTAIVIETVESKWKHQNYLKSFKVIHQDLVLTSKVNWENVIRATI